MTQWLLHLPTWMIARVSGLTAYYFLFAGMFLGIAQGTPSLRGVWKARFYRWHFRTQGLGIIASLAHALILVIDRYSPFNWSEMLLPFSHPEHPITYGLGSLAFYGWTAVLLTSDFRTLLPKRVWYALHLLSYPAFFMALIHGLYNGTDTQSPAVFAGYLATAAALLIVTFYRASAETRKHGARAITR